MSWSIDGVREADLTPTDVFRLYTDPSIWGSWGRDTRSARRRFRVLPLIGIDTRRAGSDRAGGCAAARGGPTS